MNACLLHSFVCSTRYRLWHAHSSAHHAVANKLIVWLFTSRLSNRLLHGKPSVRRLFYFHSLLLFAHFLPTLCVAHFHGPALSHMSANSFCGDLCATTINRKWQFVRKICGILPMSPYARLASREGVPLVCSHGCKFVWHTCRTMLPNCVCYI